MWLPLPPMSSPPPSTPFSTSTPHLWEKHLEWDVVLDTLVKDGNGAVGAQKVGGASVVVRELIVAHAQRWVSLRISRVRWCVCEKAMIDTRGRAKKINEKGEG